VIFHVATLMPTHPEDPHCSNKKLHIGNDFVTVIYNDSSQPYPFGTIKVSYLQQHTHTHTHTHTLCTCTHTTYTHTHTTHTSTTCTHMHAHTHTHTHTHAHAHMHTHTHTHMHTHSRYSHSKLTLPFHRAISTLWRWWLIRCLAT